MKKPYRPPAVVTAQRQPCNECPFQRAAAPGYLGALSFQPERFLAPLLGDVTMPCHQTIDYDRADWREQLPNAPHCIGATVFAANISKLPRDRAAPRSEPDRERVFASVAEFVKHHCGTPRQRLKWTNEYELAEMAWAHAVLGDEE